MEDTLKINVFGDVCPYRQNTDFFERADRNGLLGSASDLFDKDAVIIANLECALTDTASPISKIGPNLRGTSEYAEFLRDIGFEFLGIANNHIKDFGSAGVQSTIMALEKAGIKCFGAGKGAAEARTPLSLHLNGLRVGVLAVAEEEFNAPWGSEFGANIFSDDHTFIQIGEMSQRFDYVIVMYHGGVEHYLYPSPMLQERCRNIVASGAGLVLCQHSHCVGAIEEYEDGLIVYGQGNTIFGYKDNNPSWNSGLCVSVHLSRKANDESGSADRAKDVQTRIEFSAIEALPNGSIMKATTDASEEIIREAFEIGKKVQDREFVEKKWNEACSRKLNALMPRAFGFGRITAKLNAVSGGFLLRVLRSKRSHLFLLNLIRNDSHREMLITLLKRHEVE